MPAGAANMDLSIGRAGSLISRGIGLEINGEWDWIKSAHWNLFKRQWILFRSLSELEAAVRKYLEAEL